jgi:crotonobetainyl-CoA:carnitine CoA-transferase CaiB-like acyl-CoA transferase
LGHPKWCEDPRFATNQARMANRDALEDAMNAVLTTKTTNDWVEVLEAAGVPCAPVYDYAQMFADLQVRHRGLVQYARDPELGEVPHIRTPSGSARACRSAMSRPSSASTMPRSSTGSGSVKRRS